VGTSNNHGGLVGKSKYDHTTKGERKGPLPTSLNSDESIVPGRTTIVDKKSAGSLHW